MTRDPKAGYFLGQKIKHCGQSSRNVPNDSDVDEYFDVCLI